MNRTLLIFKHEFLKTIKRTGFIILTLSLPVLALVGIGVFYIVSGISKPPVETTKVGFVDEVGAFNSYLSQGQVNLIRFNSSQEAKQAFIDADINEYFVIPQDFMSTGIINFYTTQNQITASSADTSPIKNFISSNLLAGKVPENVITRVEAPLNISVTTLTPQGEPASQQGGYANFIVPGIFSFLLALSLVFSSNYVLQSLSEEKESRLMEILLSSVSTRQLLSGKVLGLGAAGLLQVTIWVVSFPLLLNLASTSIGGILSQIHIPANFWILGVLYFILGYSLFAVISASIASITSTVQEAQGLAGIYTMLNVAPFWFISLLLIFPDSPVWIIFTLFPFTAPVLTMMRLGLVGIPAWQIATNMIILSLTVLGGLLFASKLLRGYMLMYGKRPGIRQIIRSFKNM